MPDRLLSVDSVTLALPTAVVTANSGTDAATFAAGDDSRIIAANTRKQYGALSTRRVACRLTGRTVAYANVTTALTAGAAAQIPLAEPSYCSGLSYSATANAITVPATGAPLGHYEVSYGVRFSGGTAGTREVRIKVDGTERFRDEGYGTSMQVKGSFVTRINPGQVVTMEAYTAATGVSVTASTEFDVWLEVSHTTRPKVESSLTGWGGFGADEDVAGATRPIRAMWLTIDSWAHVADLHPMGVTTDGIAWEAWIAANPGCVVDIAGSFVPNHAAGYDAAASLAAVNAGTHDAELATMGTNLALLGAGDLYWRPYWEFNINGSRPTAADFITAWQRAIPIVRAAFTAAASPGQSLHIVWCFGGEELDPRSWWPGVDYVDAVSVDTYLKKWGTSASPSIGTIMLVTLSDLNTLCDIAARYDKPAVISEWANCAARTEGVLGWHGRDDWPEAIDFIFDQIEERGITYSCYFNDSGGYVGHTLTTLPNSRARFIERGNLLNP